ncbi:hypothetical protein DAPPUDRAFT_126428, partial [Daphnia pulex]
QGARATNALDASGRGSDHPHRADVWQQANRGGVAAVRRGGHGHANVRGSSWAPRCGDCDAKHQSRPLCASRHRGNLRGTPTRGSPSVTTPHIRDDKLYFAALLEHRPLYPELNPLSIMYAAAEQDVVALQASRRRYPDAFRDDLGPRIHDLVGLMACKNDWPETLSWALELNFNPFGQVMVIPGRDGADSALITPWLEALEAGSGKVISHLEELRGIE